jgi:hypothetical protein
MDVAAENATLLPTLGKPRIKDSVQASQTVRTGLLRLRSTLLKKLCPGIPPSLAKAYIIRELDVIENVPQKYIAPMMMTWTNSFISSDWVGREFVTDHEDNGTFLPYCVQEDLSNRLPRRRIQGGIVVLNREQEA